MKLESVGGSCWTVPKNTAAAVTRLSAMPTKKNINQQADEQHWTSIRKIPDLRCGIWNTHVMSFIEIA